MLEFKQDISSPKPILKSLVAFTNTAAGRLIIGVGNPLDEKERLCTLLADSISPRLVPKTEEVGMYFRFTVYLSQPHIIAPIDKNETPVIQSDTILAGLSDGALSASELMGELGLESKNDAFKRDIRKLMKQNKIEYTIQDKFNRRLQKYPLVEHS